MPPALQAAWQIGRCDSDGHRHSDPDCPAGALPVVHQWHDLPGPEPLAAWLQARGETPPDDGSRDLDAEAWCWRACFDRPTGLGADAVLGLDGLATLCEVWLNGAPLLASDNMFIAHRVPVGALLRPEGNELLIHVRPLTPRLAERRPRPRWRVPMLRQQQLRWWRTTLLGRTPGWSPPVPPVGPWRPVWLATAEALLAERLRLRAWVDGRDGRLAIGIDPAGDAPDDLLAPHGPDALDVPDQLDALFAPLLDQPLHLELTRGDRRHRVRLERQPDGRVTGLLGIDNVDLWWPHTHGEPALYAATLWLGEGAAARALPLAPVGFRTIAWQREGGDFALTVNGVPVFARGACWTPIDALRLHSTEVAYVAAIDQVRAAGLNMLRVAGPMVYEADAFHRACDAAGVLVWQDFMFANMDYPAEDAAFRASVRREVDQQLARWQASPSLALLCGNSEVEQQAAMVGADRTHWSPPLFHELLPAWCAERLPDVAYWPSSAHTPASAPRGAPGPAAGWPMAPAAGTCSYYGVGAYLRPLDDARVSGLRFASECLAFAQVPEPAALDRLPGGRALRTHHPAWKQRTPRDLGAGWDFEDVRDHYLAEVCGIDPVALRRQDHERYLLLSRVAVARVVEATVARWRAAGSACRGALVWFLRDLQAGAGWGFLDEQGAPKSAWYALSRASQPVALLLTDEGLNGLGLHAVNETADAIPATLSVAVYQGTQCLQQAEQPWTLPPRSVQARDLGALLPGFIDLAWAYRFGPPPADAVQAVLRAADGRVIGRALHLCGGWPAAQDDTPSLEARVRRLDAGTLALDLHARRLALAVQVELSSHRPEDAYFDLVPGERRTLRLQAIGPAPRVLRGAVQAANHRWPVTVQGLDEVAA